LDGTQSKAIITRKADGLEVCSGKCEEIEVASNQCLNHGRLVFVHNVAKRNIESIAIIYFDQSRIQNSKRMCVWLGKTGGAIRFPLIFSPFLIKQKGMASAAMEREQNYFYS
jgi:hypothetical protein